LASPLDRLEGKYEILEKISEGGMGSVYKVRHRLLDEVRVVKVMRPHLADDEILRARFLREAKVAIKLRHPNLAQIYDFTMDERDYAYLVMEFIDGFNLQETIKLLGRPPLGLALEISRQSLNALGYLHRKRVIHRDVSPDNLLVTRDEDRALQVKLIDLGIAKVHHEGDDSLTSAGTFLGKVRYSSPEHFQTHEDAGVTTVSDLYSFGVVLYELLTGTYPIKGTSVASLISGHLMHPPLDFATSDPDGTVPEELRSVVLKALEKNPDDRYESAQAMRGALSALRKDHPIEEEHLTALFEVPVQTTRKMVTEKPGSTQSRMDRNFGLSPTPPPGEDSDADSDIETSGTIETGGTPPEPAPGPDGALKSQLRALLLGAGKLVEAGHFDEARLQLDSVLEIDPDNVEAQTLLKAVDAADVKMRRRREDAAADIRAAIAADEIEFAESKLERAIDSLGDVEIFAEVRENLENAKRAAAEQRKIIEEIDTKSRKLVADEDFEQAVPLLREALEFDPGNREISARLRIAETGLAAQLEAKRRAKEIEDTAASIEKHIKAREVTDAEHALALGSKLYGEEDVFADLARRLELLREEILLERVEELHGAARDQMDESEFTAAIATLEKAQHLAPGAKGTDDLLASAREGLHLQEEAERRQGLIDEAAIRIERLILAGRFQTAIRTIEETVKEHGDFDEAKTLRERVESEVSTREDVESRVRSALDNALGHADGEGFSDADEAIDEARSLTGPYPEMNEWVAETEVEVHRRIETHRRQTAIEKVIQSVERQIKKDALEEAQRELGLARRLYGSAHVFDELEAAIEGRTRELRREEVETLLGKALRKRRRLEDVIADLEVADSIDPDNEKVQRLLVETRAAHQRHLEDGLAKENSDLFVEIDRYIADGEPIRAIETLTAATESRGDFREARWLRIRLQMCIDGKF
jgi:serine/threonine-protein kinase